MARAPTFKNGVLDHCSTLKGGGQKPFESTFTKFSLESSKGCQNFLEDSCVCAMKPITLSHGKETLLFSLTSPSMRTLDIYQAQSGLTLENVSRQKSGCISL